MADVVASQKSRGSGRNVANSPFYSRAYGGYTAGQEGFYREHIGSVAGKIVLDPMGGQGFLLADLAYEGANLWLGDINPALSLMASLRSPDMVKNAAKLTSWFVSNLARLKTPSSGAVHPEYVDEWIPKNIKAQLQSYREIFELDRSPFDQSHRFWDNSLRKRFAAALPLLAARELACFRSSDNYTWIKPGGLQREVQVVDPIMRALAVWLKFAEEKSRKLKDDHQQGALTSQRMNAATGDFGSTPKVDAVVTSPPYANRLDYTRMWGPESELAAAIWGASVGDIQLRQIGSNVVRGTGFTEAEQAILPKQISKALAAIRTDADYASEGYYYPFFRNYAMHLMTTCRKLTKQVKKNGVLVFLVRDTVRKDVLFPTGQLIEHVMHEAKFRTVGKEHQIVKRHVGLRRRASSGGLYGVGQQEWWLAFRQSSK